jgi:hypothetical protein
MDLFSLRKIHRICPQHRGPGPPVPAHGFMDFITRRPLASGSMARIESSKPVSWLLVSAVHRRSDGWGGWLRPGAAPAHARGNASRPSAVARWSSSFLERWWLFFMRFAPIGSQRRGEHVYANLNWWRAATKPGNCEAAQLVLVDGEGGLRWSFGSKDVRQCFLELPSSFSTDQLLLLATENLNLVAT